MSNYRYILDETGHPVQEPNLIKWAEWFETADRRVAHTSLRHNVSVSTVFLGLNHNFWGSSSPILWETMIFRGPNDGYQDRYSSREAAILGHQRAVWIARCPDTKEMMRTYRQKKGFRKVFLN